MTPLLIPLCVCIMFIVLLIIYISKLKQNIIPRNNLWGTIVIDENLIIRRVINIESVTVLKHTINSIVGISINDLYKYVGENERVTAQNIASEIRRISLDGGKPSHFEFITKDDDGKLINVMCLAEKSSDNNILCNIFRSDIKTLISHETFINNVLKDGINKMPLGFAVRHYTGTTSQFVYTNNYCRTLFENVDVKHSDWNQQQSIIEDGEILESGKGVEAVKHFAYKNGTSLYLKINKQRYIDDNKQFLILITIDDITENIEKQHEIEDWRCNLEMAVDAGQISAWTFDIKKQWGHSLYGNAFAQKGTSLTEMLEQVHNEDKRLFRDAMNSLISGQKERVSIVFRHIDPIVGQYRILESQMMARKSTNGQVTHINGIQRDVTNVREQRHFNELFVDLMQNSLDALDASAWIFRVNTKSNSLFIGNRSMNKIKTPELLSTDEFNNSTDEFFIGLKKMLNGEIEKYSCRESMLNGSTNEYTVSKIKGLDVGSDYITGFCRNVTSNMKEKENLLRLMLDEIPVGVELYNIDGVLVDVNRACVEIFGATSRESILEKNLRIDNNENYSEDIILCVKNNISKDFTIDYDFDKIKQSRRYITKNKGVVSLEIRVLPITDKEGNLFGSLLMILDNTDKLNLTKTNKQISHRYRTFINELPVGLELYNKVGCLVETNSFDDELFSGELKKDPQYNFFNDTLIPSEALAEIRKGNKAHFNVERKVENTQIIKHLIYDVNSVVNVNGDLEGYLFVVSDETKDIETLNNAKNRIERLNHINSLILENLQIGVVYVDNDFNVVWENLSVYAKDNEVAKKYVQGSTCYKSVYGLNSPCKDCLHVQSLKTGKVESRETELGGMPVEMVAKPVLDSRGKRIGSTITVVNIEERKQVMQRLHEAKIKAEEADKLKSAFLANMSHEIRTPLNSIVGFSDLIKNAEDKEVKEECSKIINTNSEILLNLINDILDLSKIEAGVIEMTESKFNISQLFKELAFSFEIRAKKGVKVICDIPNIQYEVLTDKNRITQVLSNYMSNSVKFTDSGTITLKLEIKESGILLSVADTGIGISQENISKVFDRFQKLNSNIQGTGLGLPICKTIIESLGGNVGVESEFGHGTKFWAYLPCVVVEAQNNALVDVEANTSRYKRLLVAEDNDNNFLLVSMMLEKSFEVKRAVNGEEAVNLVKSYKPDFVLMDMKMPIMDGIEATKKIREFDSKIPIVALTAYAFDVDKERAMEAGCNAFLTKPLKRKELDKILQDL